MVWWFTDFRPATPRADPVLVASAALTLIAHRAPFPQDPGLVARHGGSDAAILRLLPAFLKAIVAGAHGWHGRDSVFGRNTLERA